MQTHGCLFFEIESSHFARLSLQSPQTQVLSESLSNPKGNIFNVAFVRLNAMLGIQ